MYKILLLFSSFYSLSLSLSLFTTARQQNGRRYGRSKEREPWEKIAKNRKKKRLSLRKMSGACVSFFSFFCGSWARVSFFFPFFFLRIMFETNFAESSTFFGPLHPPALRWFLSLLRVWPPSSSNERDDEAQTLTKQDSFFFQKKRRRVPTYRIVTSFPSP